MLSFPVPKFPILGIVKLQRAETAKHPLRNMYGVKSGLDAPDLHTGSSVKCRRQAEEIITRFFPRMLDDPTRIACVFVGCIRSVSVVCVRAPFQLHLFVALQSSTKVWWHCTFR